MKTAKGLSWVLAVAGLWEILAPFIIGYSSVTGAMVNAIILGILILGIGIWAAVMNSGGTIKVLSWINAILGLWVLLSPFIIRYSQTTGAMVNDLIIGIGVVIVGIWAAVVAGKE